MVYEVYVSKTPGFHGNKKQIYYNNKCIFQTLMNYVHIYFIHILMSKLKFFSVNLLMSANY